MGTFHVKILTPDGAVYDGESIGVRIPGTQANFEVRNGHADILSTMEIGELKIKPQTGEAEIFAISGGVAEMADNSLIILARTAERPEDIDIARAKEAAERARLHKTEDGFDHRRAELALLRAINRISTAGKYQGIYG